MNYSWPLASLRLDGEGLTLRHLKYTKTFSEEEIVDIKPKNAIISKGIKFSLKKGSTFRIYSEFVFWSGYFAKDRDQLLEDCLAWQGKAQA